MNNILLQLKIKQRLNKLSSMDYDNIECWMVAEAFNKAQLDWVRKQLHGMNPMREGDEQTMRRIDDLQCLLTPKPLTSTDKGIFNETELLPENYLGFKRLELEGCKDECTRTIKNYLVEEADMNIILDDELSKPSFDWAETIITLVGNRIRIYTNNEFNIDTSKLLYYRKPRPIHFSNCYDPSTNTSPSIEVTCEFKDDIVEVLIDEAAAILAGDIEAQLQIQRNSQNADKTN